MKILISTSLFYCNSSSSKYNYLYKNIINSLNILNNHVVHIVIFYDNTVPYTIIDDLKTYNNVILHKKEKSVNRSGCFWRYEAYDYYKNYDIYFFRDIDISLDKNDKFIIENFIKNPEKIFYIFMVHKRKSYPRQGFLMGGMFGMKRNTIDSFSNLIKIYNEKNKLAHYGSDEEFLALSFYRQSNPVVFIEPRLINYNKLNNTFYNNIKLPNNYEKYITLPNNYEKYS